ncbi:MAG: AmmeMemoRadiSam system protein B [Planctomycetia bacterium]|nr:AmmeMemoRadiSam system protein B [Planctomycetia bacterium]
MKETPYSSPEFTGLQQEQILHVAARKIVRSLEGEKEGASLESWGELGSRSVYGVFVSLKNGDDLRACCGWIGQSLTLADAVDQAAFRAATSDTRFSPIVLEEIPRLKMEVWVLAFPEPLQVPSQEYPEQVEIGRHGLIAIHSLGRGLLLPGVATENHFSPEEFLERTCQKAGLPTNAWKFPETQVFRFEGTSLSAPLLSLLPDFAKKNVSGDAAIPNTRDMTRLAEHCCRNLRKMQLGQIPDFYLADGYDGEANAVCLRVKFNTRYADCAQFSIGTKIPIQSSLLQLSRNMAAAIARSSVPESIMYTADVCVLWDIHAIGTADAVDFEGLVTKRQGLLVTRLGRWTLAYMPRKKPANLLAEALKQSGFAADSETKVYSVRVACSAASFVTSSVQKPKDRTDLRNPFVAGSFYPSNVEELEGKLESFLTLAHQHTNIPVEKYAGAIVPHAGWTYSGRILVDTLCRITYPSTVLVLAPKHSAMGVDWAVSPCSRWLLPGRPMESDPELARSLVQAVPEFQLDAFAHEREHSIEVILPVLARLAPASKVIGAVIAGGESHLQESARRLANWLLSQPECPVLIASTDMNHFASEERTRQLDRLACGAIEERNPEKLLQVVRTNNISMCGVLPVALMMMTLREMNLLRKVVPVGHTTSAEVTRNRESVVGYYGALLD